MIIESRNALRRKPVHSILVTDALTGETLGQAEDLSETGMQLQARAPLVEDAIYQVRFQLDNALVNAQPINAGAHVVWLSPTGSHGRLKTGLRFLAMSEQDLSTLQRWTGTQGRQR